MFDFFKRKTLPSKLWEAVIWGKGWTDYSRWDKRKLIEQGYERNAPFYAACNIIAQTVADIPVYVDSTHNGKFVQTYNHPILALMERDMSRTEFMERLTLYLIVTGETYAQVIFAERPKRPLGLICVPSQNMNPIMGDYRNPIQGFRYEDKKDIDFKKEEIIYITRPSLRDYFKGMSAGVPLAELIDLNNACITWNKNVALAGGMPTVVAKSSGMTKEEGERLRDGWQAQSGANNSHRLKIVSENVELVKLNDNIHDSEWSKAVEQSMRMIFMAFGVSSELMNDAGNKTYCLPYDASVATPTGRKRIGEIKAGDKVYSLDIDNGTVVESNVVWQGKTGHEMTYIAKGRGFKLEATANHPVLVLDKTVGEDGRHNPTPRYKRMDELAKGDIIFKAFKYPDSAVATELPTLDVMEFYGAMLGDGFSKSYGGGRNIVSMAGNRNDAREFYSEVMASHYGSNVTELDREVRIVNKKAVEELSELGLSGYAKTKRIPEWVFTCPTEHKQAFLRGLWDTDGSVDAKGHVTFYVANKELAKDVQRLCLSLGIACDAVSDSTRIVALPNGELRENYLAGFKATKASDNVKIGSREPKDMARLIENAYAPSHGHKMAGNGSNTMKRYMAQLHHSGIEFATIVSVTEGAVQDVYDIEVEGTHNFIAENVVVHNSNYREARKALYMEASIPLARKIYGAITKQLSPYYDDKPKICLDVDKIESIQEDRGFAVERLTKAVEAGILTPNEAREELNYSAKNGGDDLRKTPMNPTENGSSIPKD
jgi:HK97 family phage portal protein